MQEENSALASVSVTDDAQPLPLNPALLHGFLPNGLQYYVVGAEGTTSKIAQLRLVVNVGSLVEDEVGLRG